MNLFLKGYLVMHNRIPQSDGTTEILGTGINQSGETYTDQIDELRNAALTEEPVQRLERLLSVFREVNHMTRDAWVNIFLRETHPVHEIFIAECVAVVYVKITANNKLTREEKEAYYGLLCTMARGARPKDLKIDIPKELPSVSRIYKMYHKELESYIRLK